MADMNVPVLDGNEIVLRDIASRVRTGGKLTMVDENMAIVASAAVIAGRYGPGPAEMELKPVDLPESVKGILAQYSS